MKRIREEQQHD